MILLDNIERLLEYVPIGPRFSNAILQALQILVKQIPKKENSKLIIFATTSNIGMMEDMDFKHCWSVILKVPQLTKPDEVKKVFTELDGTMPPAEVEDLVKVVPLPIPIKKLLMVIEMAKQRDADPGLGNKITKDRLATCIRNSGLLPAGVEY